MQSRLNEHHPQPESPTGEGQTGSLEFRVHSFIVKVWPEETISRAGRVAWRGHITHVPGGERRYLKDLDAIALFIMPYLETVGVRFGLRRRIKKWLFR